MTDPKTNSFSLFRWTLYCGLGEFIGIGISGSIAVAAFLLMGEPKTLSDKFIILFLMLFAGFIEGSVLSLFQSAVLKNKFKNFNTAVWWKFTVLAAVIGWFLGMMPSLFFADTESTSAENGSMEINPLIYYSLSILMGLILGAFFGLFQFFALRRIVKNASVWILANSLGWGAGMLFIFIGASVPDQNSGTLFIICSGAFGGITGGLALGFITGLFVKKLHVKA
jgi:hypothetical protein